MTESEWLACTDPIAMVEHLRGNPTSREAVTSWNSDWRVEGAAEGKDRKFRLFACACCRRIWDHIPEQSNRDAVVAVEDFLEGRTSSEELRGALIASSAVEYKEDGSGTRSEPGYWAVKYLGRGFYKMSAAASALVVASKVVFVVDASYGREAELEFTTCYASGANLGPFQWPSPVPETVGAECARQEAFLRCIFGNPFREPTPLLPSLLTSNGGLVLRLAEAAYEERSLPQGILDPARLAALADALDDAGLDNPGILAHLREQGRVHVRGCWVIDLLLGKS